MKRWFFLVLMLALSISFYQYTSAAGSCNPEQRILLLDSDTNAHGELWSGTYGTEICYDVIFGRAYVPSQGEDPHACRPSDENLVIKLDSDTNAHGESKDQGNYNTNICYGDLACTVAQAGSCPQGTSFVVGLTASTNAHLSDNQQQGYLNVCCSSANSGGGGGGTEGAIEDVEWQNGGRARITQSNVNSTVYLYANTNYSAGVNVLFDINERDIVGDDDIRQINAITDQNGDAISEWRISDADMNACGVGGVEGNECEFYFEAITSNSNMESYELIVENEVGSNIPPRAAITAPRHRGIYFTGVPVIFNHSSFDNDGSIVSYYWTLKDQNGLVFNTSEESFLYTFQSADQYTITLRVEDDKGARGEAEVGVVVIASPGMLAYINQPFHHQIIVNDSLIIKFNANDSYVINSQGQCPSIAITCLAGKCPQKTENHPSGCTDNITLTGNLDIGFANLNFSWEFSDGENFSSMGLVSDLKMYPSNSRDFNDKGIKLLLNYSNLGIGISKKSERVFTLLDGRQCINGGQTFVFLDENGFEIERRSTLDSSACAGPDGIIGKNNGINDDCCPTGFICTQDGCRNDENSPQECKDYEEEEICEDDPYNVKENDPLWNTLNCGKTINNSVITCACAWNETIGDGVCGLQKTSTGRGGGNNRLCTQYQCLYTYEEEECRNGFMTVNINALFKEGTCDPGRQQEYRDQCKNRIETIPCGRPTIELPFFDKIQIISTLILVSMIYMLIKHFKREKD